MVGDGGPPGTRADEAAFVLRIDPCPEAPLRGTIAPLGEAALALDFDGWIELMSALETLRGRAGRAPGADPPA